MCPISINFTQRIKIPGNENEWGFSGNDVRGVTKLQNEIYVLFLSYPTSNPNVIFVFEDRNPFRLQKKIKITEIKYLWDMVSSEKENCLYVTDYDKKCIWKITRETDDQHKISKWLTTDYDPWTLSVFSDDQLLVVDALSSILMIYGSDAELIRSIQLPGYIIDPCHAVETSNGNLFILHTSLCMDEVIDMGNFISGVEQKHRQWKARFDVSELTRDGQLVIRRFIPSNEIQQLKHPCYLLIDSDDRVFVADRYNDRVIILDSDLKWNRILCPTKEKAETRILSPWRLCYDEKKKQSIVVGNGVDVYTLSRK